MASSAKGDFEDYQEAPGVLAALLTQVPAGHWDGIPARRGARGRIAHWSCSFRPELEHLVLPGRTLDKPQLHRIEGSPATAAGLVDRELELWPAGLRDYLARRRA